MVQSDKKLTPEDIATILRSYTFSENKNRIFKLKNYYSGSHKILQKQARANTEINNKIVNNYASYISNICTGFFMGVPVSYKTVEVDALKDLRDVFRYNDESAHNLSLAETASICGVAYEVLYIDSDSQIRFVQIPAEEVVLVYDTSLEQNINSAIRLYRRYDFNGVNYNEFVDVYTAAEIQHYNYNGGTLSRIGTEKHYFGEVPVVEYPNNEQRRGDFEDVITLIDAYNLAQSLSLDEQADFTDAFLVLKNLHITADEDAQDLRRRKIIEVDENGDAHWLIKNINDSFTENLKTRLQNDIHKFSNVPDMSDDSFASNASGVAIKYKLIGLEQIRSRKERVFKKALQRRIELINNIFRLKGINPVDFRDVELQFTANIPANLQELAQVVTSLSGIVSDRTLISLLPFVENPDEELGFQGAGEREQGSHPPLSL